MFIFAGFAVNTILGGKQLIERSCSQCLSLDCRCGIKRADENRKSTQTHEDIDGNKIVNGKEVEPVNKYPWIAALFKCSGGSCW